MVHSQSAFTCSNLTIETLEKGVNGAPYRYSNADGIIKNGDNKE